MAGSEGCPTEGAERPKWGSGPFEPPTRGELLYLSEKALARIIA